MPQSLTPAQFKDLLLAILTLVVFVGLLVHAVRTKSVFFFPLWKRYTLRDNPFSFWVMVIVYAVCVATCLAILIHPELLVQVEIWRKSHDGNAVVKICTDWEMRSLTLKTNFVVS